MSVMEQWHIPHKHNKHTGTQYEPVLLFPRSQLSHWGVSHLSCSITADTAVKLSNKSVSKGSSAPPADRLTGWMTGCLFLALPELQLGLRCQRPEHGQKGARGSIKIYVSGLILQVRDEQWLVQWSSYWLSYWLRAALMHSGGFLLMKAFYIYFQTKN